jgi:hypothetical protein
VIHHREQRHFFSPQNSLQLLHRFPYGVMTELVDNPVVRRLTHWPLLSLEKANRRRLL